MVIYDAYLLTFVSVCLSVESICFRVIMAHVTHLDNNYSLYGIMVTVTMFHTSSLIFLLCYFMNHY